MDREHQGDAGSATSPPRAAVASGAAILAIGNAIVDVISSASDAEVADLGLVKGTMRLVDLEESERIYAGVGPSVEMSGGAAANTAVGVASLGARAGFVGRVGDDLLGRVFSHDIEAAGVDFAATPAGNGEPTGRCVVLVTPDAERTMCTYLGAASQLAPDDIDPAVVCQARIVYLEGYLWDLEPAKAALRRAAATCREAGGRVALSLSDSFCVERHRESFLSLVEGGVDVVFGNDMEMCLLFGVDSVDAVVAELRRLEVIGVVTLGAEGSIAVAGAEVARVAAHPVGRVVDTTGAGDLYAAGFLVGLLGGASPERSALLASLAASEVVSHVGARPQEPLARLAAEAGLLPEAPAPEALDAQGAGSSPSRRAGGT